MPGSDETRAAHGPSRVCAVVVCFHPALATLQRVVASLIPQVEGILVVDNGSSPEVGGWLNIQNRAGMLHALEVGANVGVAAAHNIGIEFAKHRGFSHVLLMDQDSVAPGAMVEKLLRTLAFLEAKGERVAAVGPQPFDQRRHVPMPLVKLGWLNNRADLRRTPPGEPVEVDMLISSGMMIPLGVIESVGAKDAALFIDYVDVDWCFRAAYHGYKIYADRSVSMVHALGEASRRVWCFGWREIFVHKPFRMYYIMRNRLLLYRKPYAPWRWIIPDWYRVLVMLAMFSLLIAPRREYLAMILRGLRDGVIGKTGAYEGLWSKRERKSRRAANQAAFERAMLQSRTIEASPPTPAPAAESRG